MTWVAYEKVVQNFSMKAAFDSAHAADYDSMMTAKVFEAMLRFSDLADWLENKKETVAN